MKFICDFCKKMYNTAKEAEECELAHKNEEARLAAKSGAERKISDAVNAFITKYKSTPSIELTEENQKIVLDDTMSKIDETFDSILKLFDDDNDVNDNK
mgnify:CR=1 FL=1